MKAMILRKKSPYEFKTFTDILQRYSDAFKTPKGNGRGQEEMIKNKGTLYTVVDKMCLYKIK